MSSKWDKYLQSNWRPNDMECGLIVHLNAYTFHHGKIFCKQGDGTYQGLMNIGGCVAGACCNLGKIQRHLKLKVNKSFRYTDTYSVLLHEPQLPLVFNVREKHYGGHLILAVDYNKKVKAFRVTNFHSCPEVSLDGWIFAEDLYQYQNPSPNTSFGPRGIAVAQLVLK